MCAWRKVNVVNATAAALVIVTREKKKYVLRTLPYFSMCDVVYRVYLRTISDTSTRKRRRIQNETLSQKKKNVRSESSIGRFGTKTNPGLVFRVTLFSHLSCDLIG